MSRSPRRVVIVVVAALLVAAACGDADDLDGSGDGGPVPTSVGEGAAASGGDGSGGGSGGAGGGDSSPAGGGTDPGTESTTPPGDTSGGEAALPSDQGGPGSFSTAYLQAVHGDRIVVEVHGQGDRELRRASVDHVIATIERVTGKQVAVIGPFPFDDARTSWSAGDIAAQASSVARSQHGGGQVVLRLLALGGQLAENDSAIGVAVSGAVAAVFVDKVDRAGSPLVGASRIEQAVTLHEVGHLFGLVDLCIDTGRDDPEHAHHSRNRDSVMYWAIESDLVGQLLGGPPPVDFDGQDLADLAAIRDGRSCG